MFISSRMASDGNVLIRIGVVCCNPVVSVH
jgi:hypothetical protein